MTVIKICGVTAPEHVDAAQQAGADIIGLMFVESSRRRVTVERARRLVELLPVRHAPPLLALPLPAGHLAALWFERCAAALEGLLAERRPLLAGVFADQPPALVNSIADAVGLDLVQLSGHERWEDSLRIRRPVVKAERVGANDTATTVLDRVEAGTASLLLLDAGVPGQLGGTGVAFDWEAGRGVAQALPCMLAGGLSPENVRHAISHVRPWGVDVSSGVESGGAKDPAKIRAFVAAVRATDASLAGARVKRGKEERA